MGQLKLNEIDFGKVNIDPTKIPPRTLNERLRLAIRWSRYYHTVDQDPDGELSREFIRHLGHLGLKLVWKDGSDLTPAQLADRRNRIRRSGE